MAIIYYFSFSDSADVPLQQYWQRRHGAVPLHPVRSEYRCRPTYRIAPPIVSTLFCCTASNAFANAPSPVIASFSPACRAVSPVTVCRSRYVVEISSAEIWRCACASTNLCCATTIRRRCRGRNDSGERKTGGAGERSARKNDDKVGI